MSLKGFNKKLSLKKITVASLNNIALGNAKGGGPLPLSLPTNPYTKPFGVCQGTVNATVCFTDCGPQVCLSH